ncbi:MAG: hypothetical protein BIP78_0305 [Candidatus Bipolaricaulis sibiricus]|uniref:Heparan-alpha-glucosaminide N-acetyltransferase catalytic domain-containing protein n=1 Tax=Bipolaricaulis sibiricus TaxID=2501609 RepID=A0A410FSX4_BIPS1|nr:MAG: hypothetical protein BIP78_0305 [Candidatus Bipolaricaulis sibiricus]
MTPRGVRVTRQSPSEPFERSPTRSSVDPAEQTYRGLDVLRGAGIFAVLLMHTAFYHFDGAWEIDFAQPPVVITVIGFLLMFAGLFAMISGFAHMARASHRLARGERPARVVLSRAVAGLFVLAVAYAYFVFTGPGLVHFESRSFDNSVLVELIQTGRFPGFSRERLLYVDSLVMIGSNAIVVGLFLGLVWGLRNDVHPQLALGSAAGVLALSLVRIPLYELYLNAMDRGDRLVVLGLNWLVNKNNPLLPYLAFGLFGVWLGLRFTRGGARAIRTTVCLGTSFLVGGLALYVLLPDTMLQRAIDLQWYAIMVLQVGLFLLLLVLAVWVFDLRACADRRPGILTRFFLRLGTVSLSVYFAESVVSAAVFRLVRLAWPTLYLGAGPALLAGLLFAVGWGLFLVLWERTGYRYSLERLYCRVMAGVGGSAKLAKLRAPLR